METFLDWIYYILAIPIAAIPVFCNVFVDKHQNFQNKIFNKSKRGGRSLTFWGYLFLLSVLCLFITSYFREKKTNEERKVAEKKAYLAVSSSRLADSLLRANTDSLNQKIEGLYRDNQSLVKSLNNTSIELNKNILGGVLCFLEFSPLRQKDNLYFIAGLRNPTKYPIYGANIIITDVDSVRKCDMFYLNGQFMVDQDCFFLHSINIPEKDVFYGGLSYCDYGLQGIENTKHLEIKITCRNSYLVEHAVIVTSRKGCLQSYRVYDISNGEKVVFEKNDLKLTNDYWAKAFFPIKNRRFFIKTL